MNIQEVLQRLDANSVIEMFKLDTTAIGGSLVFNFHAGTNSVNEAIAWQGELYQPFPIEASGFDISSKGVLPRPRLKVANVTGIMYALVADLQDLVGAKVTRLRTFAMFLDGQPGADPLQHLPSDVFYVERKVIESKEMVEFELASVLDLQGVQLPNRQITVGNCRWNYKSSECSWPANSTTYYTVNDVVTLVPLQDKCSKTINGCKKRFGDRARLPFGGFPAARMYKS